MRGNLKWNVGSLSLIILIVSLACGMPYGIGFDPDAEKDSVAQVSTLTIVPTNTPIPTPTNTATATNTPEPTPTATRVVQPTDTPTAVFGASGAAAAGGNPTAIAETAIAAGQPIPVIIGTGEIVTPTPPPPKPVASANNVIINGDFEADWPDFQGHATNWTPFAIGQAHFSWYKDTWFKVVYDGKNAQLIEIINDQNVGNTYAGIFQTVPVVSGAEYDLTIHGLVRSDEGAGGGYVLQYGIDYNGGQDWQAVSQWIDLPFPEHPREDPNSTNEYNYGTYTARVIPTGGKLTLYIRGWKKWADYNEGNFDVDAISLRGTGVQPVATPTPTVVTVEPPTPAPAATASPIPAATATPVPVMPESGGQLESAGPPVAILIISIFSALVLSAGALWGFANRKV